MAEDKKKVVEKREIDFSDPDAVLALMEQINQGKQAAVDKLKNEINERIEKLAKFGEKLRLVGESEPRPAVKKQGRPAGPSKKVKADGASAQYNDKKTCAVCNNMSGHDGRLHRFQGADKKPLTHEQMVDLGVLPPEAQLALQ